MHRQAYQHGHTGIVQPVPDGSGHDRGYARGCVSLYSVCDLSQRQKQVAGQGSAASGRGIRRRDTQGHRHAGDIAGSRAQDGQRDAGGAVERSRDARGHARVPRQQPHRTDQQFQDTVIYGEDPVQAHSARAVAQGASLADTARALRLQGPHPRLLRLPHLRLLQILPPFPEGIQSQIRRQIQAAKGEIIIAITC